MRKSSIFLSTVVLAVAIAAFCYLTILPRNNYTLLDGDIDLIVNNLTMFNYANDREERLSNLDTLLNENINMSLMANSEKSREGYSYMIGDTIPTAKISNIDVIKRPEEVFITVDYFETKTLQRKMTSVILLRLEGSRIEEVSVYDLFDNLDGNDAGL